MGWGQEAYDAECTAIARALHVAATRNHTLGTVTIFTDAQAAIWRMSSDDPGPGQKYAPEPGITSPPSVPKIPTSGSRSVVPKPPRH